MLNLQDLHPHHVISPDDRPHHLAINGIWELPAASRNRWLGGWSIAGTYQWLSGAPVEFGNVAFLGNIRDIALSRAERKIGRWFNTEAGFVRDGTGQLASNLRTFPLRLTSVRADETNHWNLSLMKDFHMTERVRFQLRADAMNAFNRASFNSPNTIPTSSVFGQVTGGSNEQRVISIIGRLLF